MTTSRGPDLAPLIVLALIGIAALLVAYFIHVTS